MECFSYEEFICAILANYRRTITYSEIFALMLKYMQLNENAVFSYTNTGLLDQYTASNKDWIWLSFDVDLDTNVDVNGDVMTLKDYFNMIAGPKLNAFMQIEARELRGIKRN